MLPLYVTNSDKDVEENERQYLMSNTVDANIWSWWPIFDMIYFASEIQALSLSLSLSLISN